MRRPYIYLVLAVMLALCLASAAYGQTLVLNDSLAGPVSGQFRSGGAFQDGGWKITNRADYLYWRLPYPIYKGAVEFSVKGLNPNECRPGLTDKSELFHMYDNTFENADTNYGGYRNNPFKHFIRKQGCAYAYNNKVDSLELVLVIAPNGQEPDSRNLSWNSGTTYLFREEWGPDGNGNCVFRTYRNGTLEVTMTEPGDFRPNGHSVKIGQARMDEWSGAPLDAVFMNMKVWDMETSIPATPRLTYPLSGKTINTRTPRIRWAYTPTFNRYQVRITTVNNPDSGIVWDSGVVTSVRNYADTAQLSNLTNYYAWLKLGNGIGWTGWTSSGHWFRVDTSYTAPNRGIVEVNGYSFYDKQGPFLGLGFTYMEGLGFCRNDRERFESDLALMSTMGFNYMRILSEVPGACEWDYWYGRGIHPSTFQCVHGVTGNAWSDYDQQFKDMIDIAYDKYGIRTEVTIFGGAGESFPTYAGRQAHCQRILDLLQGREHKVVFIEIANEAWQTGFPWPQGRTDLRNLCQYVADRTSIPVAITSMNGTNADASDLYNGSAATIATEHFTREHGEDHWLMVRDPWRILDAVGVPPCSSDEPVGPGSSVVSETDPVKLVSAACFAYIAKLPSYVFHSSAGVRGDYRFENMSGHGAYRHILNILPPEISNWTRNDGKESAAPFTAYCMGVANRYWTDTTGATNGCHRNIGGRKGNQFVSYPQGILAGGLTLQARQYMNFTVYNPITGAVVMGPMALNSGETVNLSQGPGAYIIKGTIGSGDTISPAAVTNFNGTNQQTSINLTWTNPSDSDLAGVKVLVKTTGFPTTDLDGTVVFQGSGTSCSHTGISSGVTYYYAAFAYDTSQNFSVPVTRSIVRTGADCYADSFSYPNGNLSGKNGWNGDVGSEIAVDSETVKITGGAGVREVYKSVSCSAPAGVITIRTQVKAGAGTATMWGLYIDDPTGKNLARWYGAGTTARGRIGGTSDVTDTQNLTGTSTWDNLEVKIDVVANTSQFFFNGVSIGTLSHASQGAGDTIGRIKIERIDNNAAIGHTVYLDNTIVGTPDVTPPGPVTLFRTTGSNGQVVLNWNNPIDADFLGTMIRYKTTGYPTSPTDGALVYSGAATSAIHTGLANGVKLYYSAFTYDGAPNYSAGVNTIGISAADVSIAEAKALDDNAIRYLRDKIVTSVFSGYFYIQEPESYQGIKIVTPTAVVAGNLVTVSGAMAGKASERYIDAAGNPFSKITPGPGIPSPIAMGLAQVGGVGLSEFTLGVAGGVGPNNVGSFVKVWGRVTQTQYSPVQYVYIDDGSGIVDGTSTGSTSNVGVRIDVSPSMYNVGDYLVVTGVISLSNEGGNLIRKIIPGIGGIQKLAP